MGFDFFVITRLRSQSHFKFPVETSDYYFGLNSSAKFNLFNQNFSSRLRFAHISSHVVDGLADSITLYKTPFVYSREFIDLSLALQYSFLRPYIGFWYVFSTKPKNVSKINPEIGFDFDYKLCDKFSLVGGYDFKVLGVNDVSAGANSAQIGIKAFGDKDYGISLNYYYFAGRSIHGMFYDEKDKYSAIGFEIKY